MKYLSLLLAVGLIIAISSPASAQSPGDTVGFTYSIPQSYGSTGNRIVLDSLGGKHFTWLNADPYPTNIRIYYNYLSENGSWNYPGVGMDIYDRQHPAFPQIDQYNGRAAIAFHCAMYGLDSLFLALDYYRGLGTFEFFRPPNWYDHDQMIYPFLAIDRLNRIHLVDHNTGILCYTRSNDEGATWTGLQLVDGAQPYSYSIASSPVSNKVAIAYCKLAGGLNPGGNDVCFIQSTDGTTWSFPYGSINITNYGQNNDSLFAFNNIDAIYDYNDVLHIIWNASWIVPNDSSGRAFLFHYDTGSEAISEVTRAQVPRRDSCAYWNLALPIDKMSLGVNAASGAIYTVYTQYSLSDCSHDNQSNGELFMQYSVDEGETWSMPLNITNSPTPDCFEGHCASDLWPSLADKVDDYLHIFYVCDCGGPNFWNEPQANYLLYLAYPNPLTGLTDRDNLPGKFELFHNYPNPFNINTTIKYSLKEKDAISLSIYNITGQKVATLFEGKQEAGDHQITWDAKDISSGIYFAKLETEDKSQSIRMTLLK